MNTKLKSFSPLVGNNPRVLILGSMPSVQSLKIQQYYAHPRNHFWPLMSQVLQSQVPSNYFERCTWLCNHYIALWDSVSRCFREGSQDSKIKEVEPNEINTLLEENSSIKAIFFNGVAAKKYYEQFHQAPQNIPSILLPSSSPIPRPKMITVQDKLKAWLEIQKFLT